MVTLLSRTLLVMVMAATSLLVTGFGPPSLVESGSRETAVTPSTLKQIRLSRPPALAARAAVLMDAASGQLLLNKDAHYRRAMASTTKIMTALVALENARLDEVVIASRNVVVEPTIMGLTPGDRVTVEQLLYGLLLPSGNDAAVALAEHVGGSVSGFTAKMNDRAASLGLKDTHFTNPNGLDEEGHYSSAYDLAVMTREALRNPLFEKIVATPEALVKGPDSWSFKNNNQLLQSYWGADGVKTGFTDNAGRCLVFSATRDGRRGISVVLDSPAMWEDSSALLDHYFASFDRAVLAGVSVPLAVDSAALLVPVESSPVSVAFPSWQRQHLRWYLSPKPDPSAADMPAGTLAYYLFGSKVAELPMKEGAN